MKNLARDIDFEEVMDWVKSVPHEEEIIITDAVIIEAFDEMGMDTLQVDDYLLDEMGYRYWA